MSSPMKTYRLCCFDGVQKALSVDWLEADCDEEAIAKVEALVLCSKYEIWDGKRLVAQGESERRQA